MRCLLVFTRIRMPAFFLGAISLFFVPLLAQNTNTPTSEASSANQPITGQVSGRPLPPVTIALTVTHSHRHTRSASVQMSRGVTIDARTGSSRSRERRRYARLPRHAPRCPRCWLVVSERPRPGVRASAPHGPGEQRTLDVCGPRGHTHRSADPGV